ncbi:MAG: AAA family ATPase [Polyangiaceae bacterium]
MKHGLVIGKFYPPHAGHHHLVRAAARAAARVTVVVMAAHVESLGLEERVRWMREVHATDPNVTVTGIWDDHPVDYQSDAIWRAHVDLMREAVSGVTSEPVDTVFTSEIYGEELARRLDARHVLVDLERAAVAVSGTAIRADHGRYWPMLAPCVRAHLSLRVVLVGAESTGKTTLAAALAARLRERGAPLSATTWVREIGRDVTLEKLAKVGGSMEALTWATSDFVRIAAAQASLEAEGARGDSPIVVCDTDAFATGIWHERYTGASSAEVDALGAAAPHHLYLLTHHDDVPFVQDGVRDGEHIRAWMTSRFVERLVETGRTWQLCRGSREVRLENATAAVLARYASIGFAPPLG